MPRKFQGFIKCRFGGSEKDCYFLKIPKWQHKLIREYKRGKLASYFLDNGEKTCSCGPKTSGNIKINNIFLSKSFLTTVTFSAHVASSTGVKFG